MSEEQRQKIQTYLESFGSERESIRKLIIEYLNYTKFKNEAETDDDFEKLQEYEECYQKIQDELKNKLGKANMIKVKRILIDCEKLILQEREIETKLNNKSSLIEDQNKNPILKTVEESEEKEKLKEQEETHQNQVRQFKAKRSNSVMVEIANLQGQLTAKEQEIQRWQEQSAKPMFSISGGTGFNIATGDNSNLSNQFTYHLHYDEKLVSQELAEIKKNYQTLEPTNEFLSDPQKLKKTILFLGAKQIFATTRQETINKLIETYKSSNKSGKKYDKITLIASYLGDAGEIAASIVPGGSAVAKALNEGIPIITNLLKSHSLTAHSQEFENYLIADEKSLFLLQKTYQSLIDSQDNRGKINPILTNLLKLNQDQFDQHGIFEISNLQKEEELTSEKMQNTIDLLTNHFKEFTQELHRETNQYTEKMAEIFAGAEGEVLQIELTELLEKLVGKESRNQESNLINQSEDLQSRIESKEAYLQKLVADAKNKIKSEHRLLSERRNKEREEMINNLLNTKAKTIRSGDTTDRRRKITSLQSKLLEIANEHGHKEFKTELDKLCQVQRELTQLQIKQEQQTQIEIPSK
ncbi:MAG: hypothetical protein NY202_03855 [Mollicutes bacterium UO1]